MKINFVFIAIAIIMMAQNKVHAGVVQTFAREVVEFRGKMIGFFASVFSFFDDNPSPPPTQESTEIYLTEETTTETANAEDKTEISIPTFVPIELITRTEEIKMYYKVRGLHDATEVYVETIVPEEREMPWKLKNQRFKRF